MNLLCKNCLKLSFRVKRSITCVNKKSDQGNHYTLYENRTCSIPTILHVYYKRLYELFE